MRTIIPFMEPIRLNNESVFAELRAEIEKTAERLNMKPEDFTAHYKITYHDFPDMPNESGWHTESEVYTDKSITNEDNLK